MHYSIGINLPFLAIYVMYSKRDIAQHLGIAQKHVDKFLREVSKWNS